MKRFFHSPDLLLYLLWFACGYVCWAILDACGLSKAAEKWWSWEVVE